MLTPAVIGGTEVLVDFRAPDVEVLDGLAPGVRIAAAGVAILTEGRRVRLLDEEAAAAETAP